MQNDIHVKLNQLRDYIQAYWKNGEIDSGKEKSSKSPKRKSEQHKNDTEKYETKKGMQKPEEKHQKKSLSCTEKKQTPSKNHQKLKKSELKKKPCSKKSSKFAKRSNSNSNAQRTNKRKEADSFYGIPANQLSNTFQSFIGEKSKEEYIDHLKLGRIFRFWKKQLLRHLLLQIQNTVIHTETFDEVIESSQKISKNSLEEQDYDDNFSKEKSIAFIKETDSEKINSKEENQYPIHHNEKTHSPPPIPKSPNAGEYEQRVNFISPEFRDRINKFYPEEEEFTEQKKMSFQEEENKNDENLNNLLNEFRESDDFDINDSDLVSNDKDEILYGSTVHSNNAVKQVQNNPNDQLDGQLGGNNQDTNETKNCDEIENHMSFQEQFEKVLNELYNQSINDAIDINQNSSDNKNEEEDEIPDDFIESSEENLMKKEKNAGRKEVKLSEVVQIVCEMEMRNQPSHAHPTKAEEACINIDSDSFESDDIIELKNAICEESMNEEETSM